MRIKKLIKRIFPEFVIQCICRIMPPPKKRIRRIPRDFLLKFREKAELLSDNRFSCKKEDLWPCFDDNIENTPYDKHYMYHCAWASRVLAEIKPKEHVDISSFIYFITIASAYVPIKYYEYRPVDFNLSNLKTDFADITALPYDDNSIESLSCMHAVEHIGLERYGDPFDPKGDLKAISELQRVLKPEGNLLFVVPVGSIMRIQYNAHRIYTYENIINYFSQLKLISFALITDDGLYLENANSDIANKQTHGCGCFWFKR